MRKAQVSLFIVVGVLLISSVILFLLFKGNIGRQEIAPGVSQIVEELPEEFITIPPFVEKCLEQTAIDGLVNLGDRGGYISTESLRADSPNRQGNAIAFSERSSLMIPYWHFLSSENACVGTCEFRSAQMPLEKNGGFSIEGQLEDYIDANLGACINSFEEMKKLNYEVKEERSPSSDVIIAEDNLVVALSYPIEISKGNSKASISNFHIPLDIDLRDTYAMAAYITELEKDYRFLEQLGLNLIVAFSGKDAGKLPPMTESSFELSAVEWKKSVVKSNLRDLLSSYVPGLRMDETQNWKEIQSSSAFEDALYNRGMVIPNNSSIKGLSVSFAYLPDWDPYFDLNCDGEVCRPESVVLDVLTIGLHRYHFAYDISYPVLVEIEAPLAFNERGYTFRFMLESNIRNNRPLEADFSPLPVFREGSDSYCDERKRTSGVVSLMVTDQATAKPLNDADIYYTCLEQSCYLGKTEEGRYSSAMPICLGGMITVSKDGYMQKTESFDADISANKSLRIFVSPLASLQIELVRRELSRSGDSFMLGNEETLSPYEKALVSIESDRTYELLEVTPQNAAGTGTSVSQGTYTFEISILDNAGIYIPPEVRDVEGAPLQAEAVNLSTFVVGRRIFNYTFTADDVGNITMTIPVLVLDKSMIGSIEDLQLLGKTAEYAAQYANELRIRRT